MREALDGLRQLGATLADGLRVLARHWPQFVGLYLLGAIGRAAFLWLATWASEFNATLGAFILPLAPLCSLLALILMLRVTAETLPAFSNLFASLSLRARWRDHLGAAASLLLPFLAVYASQGLLAADAQQYTFDVTMDDVMNNAVPTFDRAVYAQGPLLLAIVLAALIIRKVITATKFAERSMAGAGISAYIEALWMVTFAQVLSTRIADGIEWVRTRAVIDWVVRTWEHGLETLGVVGRVVAGAFQAVGWVTSNALALVTLPLAWLTIGAAVYGKEAAEGIKLPPRRRRKRAPNRVRTAVVSVTEPVWKPVDSFVEKARFIVAAGVVPMLLFCVVFAILRALQGALQGGLRLLVGPRDPYLDLAIEPFLDLAVRTVYFTVAMALVAAGVNTVVTTLRARREAEVAAASSEAQPQAPAPTSA